MFAAAPKCVHATAVNMRPGSTVRRTFPSARRQTGFTMVLVLLALLLLALSLQTVVTHVSQQAMREREQRLLWVGAAYARAIADYHDQSPGTVKRWPRTLESLLDDGRMVGIRRHLRELYADPMTGQADWDLIRAPDGGIQGIRSRSQGATIRSGPIDLEGLRVGPAQTHSEWRFEPANDRESGR